MKKIISLITLVVFAYICSAQKLIEGSLECLRNEREVNFVLNFDNCLIDKQPAYRVKENRNDWDKGIEEIVVRFSNAFAKKSRRDINFGYYPNAKYTLIYYLDVIDDDQDCKGNMVLQETNSGIIVAKIDKANGSAGTYGSFFNLLGDAFVDLGESLAKLIR